MSSSQKRTVAARTRRDRVSRMPHRSTPVTSFAYAGTMDDPKFGGRIVYESGIERDALIHLVFEPYAAWVRRNDLNDEERERYRMPRADRQNWTINLDSGEKVTADLVVGLRDQRMLLVEVGAHAHKTKPVEAERLQRAAITAGAEGAGYVVLTDRMLRGRLLENRRVLFGWLQPVCATEELIQRAVTRFTTNHQTTMQEVIDGIEDSTAVAPSVICDAVQTAVARAHRDGVLRCDLGDVVFDYATPCAIVAVAPE